MNKLKKTNLFAEINDQNLIVAVGKYDDELNFNIIDKEIFTPSGIVNGKIIDLEKNVENLKKTIELIEDRTNLSFSEINLITSQTDINCINVSGFKKLNGNQILSEDISYILNDIKFKLSESEKDKTIIHLFNTKYLLDNKLIDNLPIGLYGDFYSHQLSFFMMKKNSLKNMKTLVNRCNLNLNKVILKSFTDGIKIINNDEEETFIKIIFGKTETQLIFFYNSAFCFFQKFNFGSDIILKDISKVCSLEISKVRDIVINSNFKINDENMYVDKKYFYEQNFRKISLQHIIEITSARVDEMVNIIYNRNKNLDEFIFKDIPLYLEFDDKKIINKFEDIFKKNFINCNLKINNTTENDPLTSIKIFGELLSKGWKTEAIPFINKKKSWISRIFSGLFE